MASRAKVPIEYSEEYVNNLSIRGDQSELGIEWRIFASYDFRRPVYQAVHCCSEQYIPGCPGPDPTGHCLNGFCDHFSDGKHIRAMIAKRKENRAHDPRYALNEWEEAIYAESQEAKTRRDTRKRLEWDVQWPFYRELIHRQYCSTPCLQPEDYEGLNKFMKQLRSSDDDVQCEQLLATMSIPYWPKYAATRSSPSEGSPGPSSKRARHESPRGTSGESPARFAPQTSSQTGSRQASPAGSSSRLAAPARAGSHLEIPSRSASRQSSPYEDLAEAPNLLEVVEAGEPGAVSPSPDLSLVRESQQPRSGTPPGTVNPAAFMIRPSQLYPDRLDIRDRAPSPNRPELFPKVGRWPQHTVQGIIYPRSGENTPDRASPQPPRSSGSSTGPSRSGKERAGPSK